MKIKSLVEKYGYKKILPVVMKYFCNKSLIFIYKLINLVRELCCRDIVMVNSSIQPLYKNWGDDVSTVIVKCINSHLNIIPLRYSWNILNRENVLCIGSIISWLTNNNSIIWGSGVVYPEQSISGTPKRVLAVRGPLTRNYLLRQGIDCPQIYGDPALLFPRYYKPNLKKKYKLGIVPHFRDKDNTYIEKIKHERCVTIIDVQDIQNWHKFIDKICECEFVCSSSLHGIIISDAYKIPNAWIEFESGESKRFAFCDYFLSVNKNICEPRIVNMNTTIQDLIMFCTTWSEVSIDLDLLMSVCPFVSKK